jgi:hypothetical protein
VRLSILLTPFAHGQVCHGNTWTVQDEVKLADQIASVALGQSLHVQRILAGANLGAASNTKTAANSAVALLTVVEGDPWHRDGWMFQVMSWIAAHAANPGGVIRSPQMILAHKGFDGLELEIDGQKGAVSAVIIFEDKATDNPRKTIREEVWPDFRQLEAGDRDNVLTAEVVALLQTVPAVDPDIAISNIIWKQTRHYRVAITVGDSHSSSGGHKRLFRNYDKVATGALKKRRAETFRVDDLRRWMSELAAKSITAVQKRTGSSV